MKPGVVHPKRNLISSIFNRKERALTLSIDTLDVGEDNDVEDSEEENQSPPVVPTAPAASNPTSPLAKSATTAAKPPPANRSLQTWDSGVWDTRWVPDEDAETLRKEMEEAKKKKEEKRRRKLQQKAHRTLRRSVSTGNLKSLAGDMRDRIELEDERDPPLSPQKQRLQTELTTGMSLREIHSDEGLKVSSPSPPTQRKDGKSKSTRIHTRHEGTEIRPKKGTSPTSSSRTMKSFDETRVVRKAQPTTPGKKEEKGKEKESISNGKIKSESSGELIERTPKEKKEVRRSRSLDGDAAVMVELRSAPVLPTLNDSDRLHSHYRRIKTSTSAIPRPGQSRSGVSPSRASRTTYINLSQQVPTDRRAKADYDAYQLDIPRVRNRQNSVPAYMDHPHLPAPKDAEEGGSNDAFTWRPLWQNPKESGSCPFCAEKDRTIVELRNALAATRAMYVQLLNERNGTNGNGAQDVNTFNIESAIHQHSSKASTSTTKTTTTTNNTHYTEEDESEDGGTEYSSNSNRNSAPVTSDSEGEAEEKEEKRAGGSRGSPSAQSSTNVRR